MKNIRALISVLLLLSPWAALAQSTAEQVQPGFLTTSGCPGGQLSCFLPYSSANPLPVTGISPSGGGTNGGNSCAGYSTTLACALAIGYSDPRINYDTTNNSYTPSRCNGSADDTAGFQNAAHFTRTPVMDPTNGSSLSGQGGSVRCIWASAFVAQDDNGSIFHFPQKIVYNDTLDTSSIQIQTNGISQVNQVVTTITVTSGSPTATVGSTGACTSLNANTPDLYDANLAIPGGTKAVSCTGTTLTMSANATGNQTAEALWAFYPLVAPYNCAFNLHGHVNWNFTYMNFRGQQVGYTYSGQPVSGTVFGCDDVNTSTQALPFISVDHTSIRQMGNGFGCSINVTTGLCTGVLGNNELELRITDSIINSIGYVTNGNTPDLMINNSEAEGACGGFIGPDNVKITNNRIEFGGLGGCAGPQVSANKLSIGQIQFGTTFVVGGAINEVISNQFQNNGGPALEFTGFDGEPVESTTAVVGNTFSQDAANKTAGEDAEIVFNNKSGWATQNVAITGNTGQRDPSGQFPNYFIAFEGTTVHGVSDDLISVIGNTLGPKAYVTAAYHFDTETPAHIKSWGNSGEVDFQQGFNTAYCKVTSPLSAFDLQACTTGFIPPNFSTASRPTCTSGIYGEMYFDTTTNALAVCQGASPAWSAVGGSGSGLIETSGITVDGGGVAITTGNKGYIQVPYNATVSQWTVIGDQSGSAVFDIKRSTYAGFPPTVSLIGGGNAPTLSSAQNNTAAPSGWTSVTLNAGDVLLFSVSSASTVQRVNLVLQLTRL